MLLHHDGVDNFRVLEREEAEASGPTARSISHDGRLGDFSELGEIIS